jgi:putative ABC transport system permease protein
MLKIILKNIFRSFVKYLNISLINLVGLVLAFTVFIFIGKYILYENSFDKFWSQNEQIYRINRVSTQNGEVVYDGAQSPRGIYFARNEIPEVEACGYSFSESCQVRKKPYALFEQKVLWVSNEFQKVFDFKMAEGVADFEKTHTGIISESKAKVLFGNENPVGQIIKVNEGMPIEITGVFKDLPANTHLEADYFISSRTWVDYGWISANGEWNWNGWWTYVKLKPGAHPADIERNLAGLVQVHLPNLKNENRTTTFHLQPLSSIHFDTTKQNDYGKKASRSSLINLLLFGAFVLLVAWINHINLSTALAIKKEKSIGIQKLVGASNGQQILYVVIDNLLYNLLAAGTAWILYWVLSPFFAKTFDIPLLQSYFPKGTLLLGFTLAIGAGIVFSSIYSVLSILKINPFVHKTNLKDGTFQRGLVIAQLCITILFISMSILIYRQMSFVQKFKLGMDIDKVLVLSAPTSFNGQVNPNRPENPKFDRFYNFRKSLLKNPMILSATATSGLPGSEMWSNDVHYTRPNVEVDINNKFGTMTIDNGFVETFGLELLCGNPLPDSKYRYRQLALINEEAVKSLHFNSTEEAVGQILQHNGRQIEICGVMKNFHFEGLQKNIYPFVMEFGHPTEFGYYPIKVNTSNISEVMKYIENTWKQYYPEDPFNCFFQDEFYNRQYESFQRMAKFNIIFAFISVLISCLGLYGIVMFFIARKRKEIGVRKVNGATITHIMYQLNRNILIWIAIAFVVATPIAWFILHRWLENFAYKTTLSWWIFALAGLLALGIALLTVSFQSYKAAAKNPVESLRYE